MDCAVSLHFGCMISAQNTWIHIEYGSVCAPFGNARYRIYLSSTPNRRKYPTDARCDITARRLSWLPILVPEHIKHSDRAIAL